MTDSSTLDWSRSQPWQPVLSSVPGTEILAKILESDLQPDNPASVAAFLARLDQPDAAILSNALSNPLYRKPIDQAIRRSYWHGFVMRELRARRTGIESALRLSADHPEARAQAEAELKDLVNLELAFEKMGFYPGGTCRS